jgi:inner membrane protein
MTARTHDVAAVVALVAIIIAQPPGKVTLATAFAAFIANQLGGIAPDIDQPTAPFWRNLPIGRFFGKLFGKLLGGHRFLSHSLLGVALFSFLVKLLLVAIHPIMPHVDIGLVWWSFVIGMLSHLIMDSFTKEGVPWLLPIPVKFGFPPLRQFRVTTGKAVENFFVLPLLFAVGIWLCARHYDQLAAMIHQHVVR